MSCDDRCFYCRAALARRHEHDHFPIPHRNGGARAYCVCLNCHDLKDRTPFKDWPADLVAQVVSGETWENLPTAVRLLLGKALALTSDALARRDDP